METSGNWNQWFPRKCLEFLHVRIPMRVCAPDSIPHNDAKWFLRVHRARNQKIRCRPFVEKYYWWSVRIFSNFYSGDFGIPIFQGIPGILEKINVRSDRDGRVGMNSTITIPAGNNGFGWYQIISVVIIKFARYSTAAAMSYTKQSGAAASFCWLVTSTLLNLENQLTCWT